MSPGCLLFLMSPPGCLLFLISCNWLLSRLGPFPGSQLINNICLIKKRDTPAKKLLTPSIMNSQHKSIWVCIKGVGIAGRIPKALVGTLEKNNQLSPQLKMIAWIQNYHSDPKVSPQPKIIAPTQNYCPNPKFLPKPKIFDLNPKFRSNPKFSPKCKIFTSTKNFHSNPKFLPKPKILTQTQNFHPKPKFSPKPKIFARS